MYVIIRYCDGNRSRTVNCELLTYLMDLKISIESLAGNGRLPRPCRLDSQSIPTELDRVLRCWVDKHKTERTRLEQGGLGFTLRHLLLHM